MRGAYSSLDYQLLDRHAEQAHSLHGQLEPLATPSDLEQDWLQLQPQCNASFFLSWSWICTWLEVLPVKAELYVYRCFSGERLVAMCVVNRCRLRRRGLFSSRILCVNETRLPGFDMTIEYNGLLIQRGYESTASAQFLRDMKQLAPAWDELVLSGLPQKRWLEFVESENDLNAIVDERRSPWVTHLPSQRMQSDTLFSSPLFSRMSSNRRWQIKRSFKEYEKIGPLSLSAARSVDEALAYFDAMGSLHTQRWNRVGQAGAFANKYWVEFHRALIRQAFHRDELQLLRINCGELAIGYVYNFLWRGRVYMLQTGLSLQKSNALRPGYVSHCLAINYNAGKGLHYYDFLCGDSDYKQVLGQADQPLLWGRLQKRRWKFKLENVLVGIYRRMKVLRSALSGKQPEST